MSASASDIGESLLMRRPSRTSSLSLPLSIPVSQHIPHNDEHPAREASSNAAPHHRVYILSNNSSYRERTRLHEQRATSSVSLAVRVFILIV